MNFDWIISLSTALFASIIGTPLDSDIQKSVPESREKISITSDSETKIATEADLIHSLKDRKFIPKKDLLEKSKKPLTKEVLVNKLLEEVEAKIPKDFSYPPIKEAIKFRDISEKDPIFKSAQKLKSLEILPENNGFFGKSGDKNPKMKISEMKKIVNKAFDEKGNLNFLVDKDNDGIVNSLDACPDLPAPGGCPVDEPDPNDKFPTSTVLTVSPNVIVYDEKEIQIGDKFSAIIFDPVTKEIFSQSETLTVTK